MSAKPLLELDARDWRIADAGDSGTSDDELAPWQREPMRFSVYPGGWDGLDVEVKSKFHDEAQRVHLEVDRGALKVSLWRDAEGGDDPDLLLWIDHRGLHFDSRGDFQPEPPAEPAAT